MKWKGRWPREHPQSVQAGHATSKFSGLTERFLVEDAAYNQMFSTPERRGTIITRQGILIKGVPFEKETVRYWVEIGELDEKYFKEPEWTWGWT